MEPLKIADSASIVLVGSFNPAIFHPAWFQRYELVPATEAENAAIEVISPDIALFTMNWLRIEVIRERFVARTHNEGQFGPLRDLAIGVFRLLEHIPIRQMGLNRDMKFDLRNEEAWHAVGHSLAPKELWLRYLGTPGMKSLTIEARRDDDYDGTINVTVRPVAKNIVEVATNNHFELGEKAVATDAVRVIEESWDRTTESAMVLARGILRDALSTRKP